MGSIPGLYLRRIQPGLGQQRLHLHKGFAVFLVWRRIHDDAGATLLVIHPQVTAKTGIGRGQAQGLGQQSMAGRCGGQPLGKLGGAVRVGPHYRGNAL